MILTLREEDAIAVDLLLDTTSSADGRTFAPVNGAQQVPGVERVLSLLQWMPENDPPQDLAVRTIKYCDNASTHDAMLNAAAMPLTGNLPTA